MASSRQNSSQMLNSQSSSSNSTNSSHAKDKTAHVKSDPKNKHDKNSSSSSGHIPMSSNTIINSMNNMSKRKGTSFQITSVSVSSGNAQQQRAGPENNNDYETPSFSEDTFSREDVFFAQPNAFGTAPVIPTSSQYGLAIVGPDLGGNGSNMTDVHVSVSDAGINIMGQIPSKQDVDHKNERFKVVKIESTEPFKRGRWMCMDYLDHTTLQAQDDGIDGTPKEEVEENLQRTKDSGLESGIDSDINLDNGDLEQMNDNDGFDQEVMRAEMMNHPHVASHEHHTMTSITIHSPMMGQIHAQSMPQGHIQQIISQENTLPTNNKESTSESLPSRPSQNVPLNVAGHHNQEMSPLVQHNTQSMTPDMIQRSLHDSQHQGATLPANILMQNLGLDHHHQQSQISAASNATSSPIPSDLGSGENEYKQDSQTSQFQNQQVGTGDSKHHQPSESDQQLSCSVPTNDNITNYNNSVSDNNEGTQNTPSPSSSAGLGTVTEGGVSEINSNNANNVPATGADDGQSLNEDSESASGTSAVAIDNKIEQAMDLVKSHLMFAVREEVEVLKEKIAELMDRINQLEVENTILKANASQETLSQLTNTIVVSPQTQVQTSPAQPQITPALSKIGIEASVLQVSNMSGLGSNQVLTQQPTNPPPQNPSSTS